ncbi:zinc-dependent alcohol dehydrogenase [Spiribacter pallidus]|jgi:threonine dehydrogenase-like Zn-dependent dehydrogenase|uniref:Alcohol dehydrogenase catalytic domain-containing protein n=1 Tax=Spiribacter pallidus TaxID=1987936 RepID=A0ABV3TBU9_9GAMM
MQALVYEGPQQLRLRDLENPRPEAGEALVRVERVGICGSDLHAYHGHDDRRPAPLILGHEPAGTVVSGPDAGRRVAVNPLVTCGRCRSCLSGRQNLCPDREILSMPPREGAFAEYIAVPYTNLFTVPDALGIAQAALAEPMAVAYHAVRLALAQIDSNLSTGTAFVIGGGAIGLGAALVLRARGLGRVVVLEANPLRREVLSAEPGLEVRSADDAALSGAGGCDLVVDAVGGEATRRIASDKARAGGVIIHPGLQGGLEGLDIRRMTLQEITFIGCYTYTMVDFAETVEWLAGGRFGALAWIEERPLAEGATAFAEIVDGRCAAPKVILDPTGSSTR